ncbi:MAG: sigma-70 family RNA polymerase sigma factor [bacterium]
MTDNNNFDREDGELVTAIKQNDHSAFKELYFKYYEQLIRFVWYRTHSMDTSGEYVQEIFTRLWIKRHLLEPDKPVKAYLYKSLTNLIIDQSKLSFSQTKSLENVSRERGYDNRRDIDLKIDINSAVEKLPPKLKTVFMLSRVEGFKYEEIAGICEISIKAVEKRMSSALTILRKIFLEK